MKIIAINIEKGGAGKTTISCHLAWHLADQGARVLFLDLDRQRNASLALADFAPKGSLRPFMEAGSLQFDADALQIFSNDLDGSFDADYGAALNAFRTNMTQARSAFDFCIIDTPPAWGWLNFAALMVADHLIVPVQLGPFGPESTRQLSNSIQTVNDKGRTTPIHLAGLVPNIVKASDSAQLELLAALRQKVGANLFTNILPDRAHYSQAVSAKVPVWRLQKDTRGSVPQMRAFLNEAMHRVGAENYAD